MIKNSSVITNTEIQLNYSSTDESDTDEKLMYSYARKEEEIRGNFSFIKKVNSKIKKKLKPETFINE